MVFRSYKISLVVIKVTTKKAFLITLSLLFFLNPIITRSANNCLKEDKVIAVCDGDTIIVSKEGQEKSTEWSKKLCSHGTDLKKVLLVKVRLLGIDSFEVEQNKYGKEAKAFLTKALLSKKVCVETDVQEKDIYNRTLGYVFLTDKLHLSINEELLKNGLSIVYSFQPNTKYLQRLKKAQMYARQNMLGVWKESNYILETPAQWRKKHS